MRRAIGVLVVLCILVIGGLIAAYFATNPKLPQGRVALAHRSEQDFGDIERGRYLTTVADCAACHTDTNGGKPFAGGRPIETPFGMILAANITPDPETGIGSWTEQDFANVLQHGFGKNGQMIYPAMPYNYYTKVTGRDVGAIFAYLRTIPPVHNKVITDQLPFPLNIRLGMRAWDLLFFKAGRFQPDPSKDAKWNRGAYLVTSLEHCGACHTPKNVLGGDDNDRPLQGYSVQGWFAPNITNDNRRGLGHWSVADIVQYLQTGHNKQAAASGPMAEEVMDSSSRMPADDLEAIATYLKSMPGQQDKGAPIGMEDARMETGKAIYDDSCSACHRHGGQGVSGLFPTLKTSPSVQSREPTSLIRVVLDGAKSVATDKAPTGAAMPSYNWQLDDQQVADVLTYVRNAWGNQASAVSQTQVSAMRKELRARPH